MCSTPTTSPTSRPRRPATSCSPRSGTQRCARHLPACRRPPSKLIALLAEDRPLPYAQISARLGIPAGSIGPTRGRCLAKLRRHPAIAALINAEPASVEK
jgi:DNA-directed RNA polymerase specialized sigma24 family protein